MDKHSYENNQDEGGFYGQNGISDSNSSMIDSDFHDFADDPDSSRNNDSQSQANAELVPVEFAKAHIAKIEEDMKRMHERHVKLMREMDNNYKMIEQET
jgi:hypothetical protein